MTFPKDQAFSVVLKSFEQAVSFATTKRKVGGCYEREGENFRVYWLAKDDSRCAQFAW